VPAVEKRSGRVELRQSPNRKNHYNRHKSRKFGALVEGPQMIFLILIVTVTDRGGDGNTRQCAASPIGIRDRAQALGINKK
jgi:hypothetical protein